MQLWWISLNLYCLYRIIFYMMATLLNGLYAGCFASFYSITAFVVRYVIAPNDWIGGCCCLLVFYWLTDFFHQWMHCYLYLSWRVVVEKNYYPITNYHQILITSHIYFYQNYYLYTAYQSGPSHSLILPKPTCLNPFRHFCLSFYNDIDDILPFIGLHRNYFV